LIARFGQPALLAQLVAGLAATRLGTKPLVITIARIGPEQLLATQTSTAAALGLHAKPPALPDRPAQRKKTRKKTEEEEAPGPKKEEQLDREAFEENRSRRWLPFTWPALAPFQITADINLYLP
jgi:hypothetical protein